MSDPAQKSDRSPIAVHSVVLSKSIFDRGAMQAWLKDNDLSAERPLDLGENVIFIQKDTIGLDFESRVLGEGVTVHFEKGEQFQVTANFRKDSVNEELRTVEGIVYEPFSVDSQGDWATPEDIREAAHDFLKSGLIDKVDVQHSFQTSGAYIVESFLAKDGDPHYKPGTWVVKVKVPSDAIWAKIKDGKITGFSMAGGGQRSYYEANEDDGFKKSCDGSPKKARTRLTKIRVKWISLVDEAANLKSFSFVKSAHPIGETIWKSRDQPVLDGELEQSEGFFRRFELILKRYFGGKVPLEPFYPEPALPVTKGKVGSDVLNQSQAGIFVLLGHLAGRAAKTEQILKALASHPQVAQALQGNPGALEQLQKMNPGDLEQFQKDVMTAFMSQSGTNGVSLPNPQNFFGWASQQFDIGRFVSGQGGAFPGGGMDMGSVAGASASFADLSTMKSKLDDMFKQLEAMTGRFTSAVAENDSLKKSMGSLQEKLDATASRVEALQKSATPPDPAGGAEPPTPPPAPSATSGSALDPLLKSKNAENPYGTDPVAVFGGILNSGKNTWLASEPAGKK